MMQDVSGVPVRYYRLGCPCHGFEFCTGMPAQVPLVAIEKPRPVRNDHAVPSGDPIVGLAYVTGINRRSAVTVVAQSGPNQLIVNHHDGVLRSAMEEMPISPGWWDLLDGED